MWIAIGGVAFVLALYFAAVALIAKYDRLGLFPRNEIKELDKEDGGPGPIEQSGE